LLVEKTLDVDLVVGAYVGILGETGLRMTEGLELEWEHVLKAQKQLVVKASKNYKVRHVPLSEYALEFFDILPKIEGNPFVFVRTSTMERLRHQGRSFMRVEKLPSWSGLAFVICATTGLPSGSSTASIFGP
jgi:integrase